MNPLTHINGGRELTTIMTLMWGNAYERYGRNFCSTFEEYWPQDVSLRIVSDVTPLPGRTRASFINTADIEGLQAFRTRHAGDPAANGMGHKPSIYGADERGYHWKWDAVKWSWQAMAPEKAVETLPDGAIVAWFDADVVTHTRIPEDFIEKMLGDADLCHLGRAPKHSEIGFFAIRLNALTRIFLSVYASLYREDEIFKLKEWHSAYAFDVCIQNVLVPRGGKVKNLTPGGRGHVWMQSPLVLYTWHLKGKRKEGALPKKK